jgi:hypothetical protein
MVGVELDLHISEIERPHLRTVSLPGARFTP